MNQNQNPIAFFKTAKKALAVMKEAREKTVNDPQKRAAWNDAMVQNRWKNLAWSGLFTVLTGAALYAEVAFTKNPFTDLTWIIIIGFTGIFTLIGALTLLSYLWIIVRK